MTAVRNLALFLLAASCSSPLPEEEGSVESPIVGCSVPNGTNAIDRSTVATRLVDDSPPDCSLVFGFDEPNRFNISPGATPPPNVTGATTCSWTGPVVMSDLGCTWQRSYSCPYLPEFGGYRTNVATVKALRPGWTRATIALRVTNYGGRCTKLVTGRFDR